MKGISTAIRRFLKSVDIFSALDSQEIHAVQQALKTRRVEAGTELFHEGDEGNTLFIVREGKLSISVTLPDGEELPIADFGPGDFVGEMSIIEDAPRSATLTARESSVLLTLDGEDFYDIMDHHPSTANKIMFRMVQNTVERLTHTGALLSDMVTWGENARQRAVTDDFTGLYNRRFLDDALDARFVQARITGKPMSVVMVDLDRFGKLNEVYGESIADEVLLSVVPVFRSVFREQDILSRYGGDEFTFILPDTEGETGLELCKKLLGELSRLTTLRKYGGSIDTVTASIGVASFPRDAGTLRELKEKADGALYRAKELGRARAELA